MDWSTRSVVDLMEQMRISAGTLSPTGQMQKGRGKNVKNVKLHFLLALCKQTEELQSQ